MSAFFKALINFSFAIRVMFFFIYFIPQKLKLNGLAELNRKFKEEFNIQEEAFTSPTTAKVEEPKEEVSAVNVNLKILTVDSDFKKAFYVYKTIKAIIEKIEPSRPSNLGE